MGTYGRTTDVGRMIASLGAQTSRAFELIVVDQNSDDRLRPFLSEGSRLGIDIVHARLATPNLSAARNLGLKMARHEVIAFPDDDCWYDSSVVSRVLELLADGDGLGGVVAFWPEDDPARHPAHAQAYDLAEWRRFRGPPACSITIFVRRSVLEAIGGFDERMGVSRWFGSSEDIDLMFRLLAAGVVVRYEPRVVVHHPASMVSPEHSLAEIRKQRLRQRGIGAIYAKHRLAWPVVARGLVSPLVRPFLPPKNWRAVLCGIAVSWGRIEGYVRWRASFGSQ
jgi:glycosyltransferase involved in cell wall biosynthesis